MHARSQLAIAAALVVAGCHSTPSQERDAAAQSAIARGSASAPVAASAAAPPARRPAAGDAPAVSTAPTGEPASEVVLNNGATLKLPGGAFTKPFDTRARLPEEVLKAHMFKLGAGKRMLMVNEMKLVGDSCKASLDRESKRMKTAQDDTNPERLKYRKVGAFEELNVGGHRVLYSESKNRGFGLTGGPERPMVGMATMLMCRDDANYVALMFASDKADLEDGLKGTLTKVVASYAKK
jgi:hypothetical protein